MYRTPSRQLPHSPRPGCATAAVRGFTLLELLVVIALLSVLAAFLVPAMMMARHTARQVVCLSRLRDLSLASKMYFTQHHQLPEAAAVTYATGPHSGVLTPSPHAIDLQLLNRLQPYLKYPMLTAASGVKDLPPVVQCPFLEAEENNRGPFASLDPAEQYFYTGYAYVARIEEVPQPPPSLLGLLSLPPVPITLPPWLSVGPISVGPLQVNVGVLLKPGKAATAKLGKDAVVWADDVHYDTASGGYWRYGHVKGLSAAGPIPLSRRDSTALAGQHRAFTDGSVRWVPRKDLGVDPPSPGGFTLLGLNLSASFRIGSSTYWWF